MARANMVYAIPTINPVQSAVARFISKKRMQIIIATHVTCSQKTGIGPLTLRSPGALSLCVLLPLCKQNQYIDSDTYCSNSLCWEAECWQRGWCRLAIDDQSHCRRGSWAAGFFQHSQRGDLASRTHPDAVEDNIGRAWHLVDSKWPMQRVWVALVPFTKDRSFGIRASICGRRRRYIWQVVDGCFAHVTYPISLQA